MAYRKKAHLLLAYKPDIVVVPECEQPEKLVFEKGIKKPTDVAWTGENKHKGLGIFSYSRYRFHVSAKYDDRFKLIIPIEVTGQVNFTLFAVWANNPNDPDGNYVTQVWKALHHYEKLITDKRTILAGDFNSNTIWDRPKREGNHSTVVRKLEEKGIVSAYHHYYQQQQGKEKHPTQYMYRHKDKPYHLDYCFASADMLRYLKSVEIGSHKNWSLYSDHVPVITTFKRSLRNHLSS